MTIQNIIEWFSENQQFALVYFLVILVLAVGSVLVVNNNNFGYIKYVLSTLVYAVTIPGILAAILTLYVLFIQQTSLLTVSIVTYFLPIVAMAITLIIISRKVPMKRVPGFDRLSGLMVMIGVAFSIVFVLQKTHFGILFIGGFTQLLIVFALVLIIIKVAWSRIMK